MRMQLQLPDRLLRFKEILQLIRVAVEIFRIKRAAIRDRAPIRRRHFTIPHGAALVVHREVVVDGRYGIVASPARGGAVFVAVAEAAA